MPLEKDLEAAGVDVAKLNENLASRNTELSKLSADLEEREKALAEYQSAYRLMPLPGLLFNIGQCHRYLGQCDQANFFFRQYLAGVPNSPHEAKVKELMVSCKPAGPGKPARRWIWREL